ncbi:DNA methyltransferase [Nitratireductor basaltis]|uniref:DNA (cytosine-5-)-methyltransferase n=1 Tax=Nitratireductor basaltis TaxID=472175 RepID=A0A084UES7_9HYPH|nr:DNA methyltransferase [Nitratireductor basaltis]
MKLIRELKPKAVMLENVTGALQASNAMHRLRILARMAALGYDAEWRILSGPDFGLPQKRRRAILVGFRRGIMHRFSWPEPLAKNAPTVGEALYDLMAAKGWAHVDEWKERANGYAPTIIGGSQKKGGIDLAQPKSRESWRELGVDPGHYAKAAPDRDAPRDHMPKLTLEMMARLQGFLDDWQLQGSNLQKFRQIANAFPPAMAQAIGLSILRVLTGYKVDLEKEQKRLHRKSLNLKAVPDNVDPYPSDWDGEELTVG